MSRARTRSENRDITASPRAGADRAAPARKTPARKTPAIAAMAMLVVLIGGVAGAHLALTSAAEEVRPAARVVLAAGPPQEVDEAMLARVYEEPLEPPVEPLERLTSAPTMTPILAPTSNPVRRVAPPAPSDVPAFVPARRPPLWLRNAVRVRAEAGQPMIAIVLDDLGLNRPAARRAIRLPAPLTLSFMTYAEGLPRFAADARAAGHELLLHVPMEPRNAAYDPGPNALRGALPRTEIARRLEWGLGRFEGFVGINNHMGSKFTAAPEGVGQVMRELRARDLLFLDSVTSPASVAWRAAARAGVPFARRDVFLDHDRRDPQAIRRQLGKLERIARRRGHAVGIGHPHGATLDILAAWLPEARRRGIALVPISAIVNRQIEIAQRASGAAG